jgi:NADH:ubiquinone oxidoreductase subunit 2 (subunit N)
MSILYNLIYGLSLNLFLWIFMKSCSNKISNYNLSDFARLPTPSPVKTCLIVALGSLAGLPPFSGFFTKILILNSLISWNLLLLSFLILPFFLLAFYFYLNTFRFVLSQTDVSVNTWICVPPTIVILIASVGFSTLIFNDLILVLSWFLLD